MRPAILSAMLYAAAVLGANPLAAQNLTPDVVQQALELRQDEMRKLILHDTPVPLVETAYQDAEGNPLDLMDSNGKFRVVNFWATWCVPCREEMATLSALQDQLGGEDFAVMAIATGRNRMSGILKFNADHGVTLPVLLDPKGQLASSVGALGLPVTILLNPEGQEIGRLTGGADWASENAITILSLLAGLTAPEI